jgi:hypothetical protein
VKPHAGRGLHERLDDDAGALVADLFEKSAALEDLLNARRDALGKDHVYLTRFAKPLREAIGEAQTMLPLFDLSPDADTCDEGYCWT